MKPRRSNRTGSRKARCDEQKTVEEKYNIKAKTTDKKFELELAKEMKGKALTMKYIQDHGFTTPMRFVCRKGLGETKECWCSLTFTFSI